MPNRNRSFGTLAGQALARLGAGALFSTFLLCCGIGPHLDIEICGDLRVPDQIDAIRLSAELTSGELVTSGYMDLLDPTKDPLDLCQEIESSLPISFLMVEGRGDMLLTAEALLDGIVTLKSQARVQFPDRGGAPVNIVLSRSCAGIVCARGQTCQAGRCEIIPRDDTATCPEPVPPLHRSERCPEDSDPDDESNEEVES